MAKVNTQKRDVATPEAKLRNVDREVIERWTKAEGVDLKNEAQRAKQKFRNVDRARG